MHRYYIVAKIFSIIFLVSTQSSGVSGRSSTVDMFWNLFFPSGECSMDSDCTEGDKTSCARIVHRGYDL